MLPKLVVLNIAGTKTTDASLTVAKELLSLGKINVAFTGVTADGATAFRAFRPKVDVAR